MECVKFARLPTGLLRRLELYSQASFLAFDYFRYKSNVWAMLLFK